MICGIYIFFIKKLQNRSKVEFGYSLGYDFFIKSDKMDKIR